MYLILNSAKLIVEVCRHPCYVVRQDNGVVILSDKEHADAIYSNDSDSFYPLERVGYLCDGHTLEEVESVPESVVAGFYYYHAGEFYTTEANLSALAKADAPNVANLIFVSLAEDGKFDDTTLTEHAGQFLAWTYPRKYTQGTILRYEGKLYRVIQKHTSQADWTPDATTSLYKEIGDPTAEWPEWSQPLGDFDTYALGAKVSHGGKHWTSDYDNNVWEPGVFGWTEVEE